MGGKRRLRAGLERVLPDHRSALGQALRREYRALVAGLGINGNVLLQHEAARVALLRVRAHEAARVWGETVEHRRTGRGRRPSSRVVEQAARRAALDDQTATHAYDRLRAMVPPAGRTLAEDLAEARAQSLPALGSP